MSNNSIPRGRPRRPPTLRELQRVAGNAEAPTLVEAFPGGSLRQFLDDQLGAGRLRRLITTWVEEQQQAIRQALAALCEVRVVTLEEIFPPGTFCGDVLVLLDKEKADEERYLATRRLATRHLTWHSVYGSSPGLQQRWERVRSAFEEYCREHGLSYDRGWEQLVTQIVCDLVLRLPDDVTFGELRWYLTLELRKVLERELLGRTADQLGPIDSAERIVVAEDVPAELVDVRLDVWLVLQQLDPLDRELLVDVFLRELSYSELAAQYGVSEKTIRRRVASALQWLRSDWPS
jgi:RNA polymerase sigma factor (sigma-70 family)